MTGDDRRLIEDYLPIETLSRAAAREDKARDGHIKMLHLWRARRPLVAVRAAIYAALVSEDQFVSASDSEGDRKSAGRANAAKFLEQLCTYPGSAPVIAEAEKHILLAHAARLAEERGESPGGEDVVSDKAPRPKVLDMFAGGGAIPLEAMRLGCDAYALDLNPVAHIIQLCTLVYAQRYGSADPRSKGCANGGTWAGLVEEVKHWAGRVLEKVREEIGDLYPSIADPRPSREAGSRQSVLPATRAETPAGHLRPVAYLWTRTVRCKKPSCGAAVPLARQTWLRRKKGRFVALKVVAPPGEQRVQFRRIESADEAGLGFDPGAGSEGGNATCPFCGTVADNDYVQEEGRGRRVGQQLMAVVAGQPGAKGKLYFAAGEVGSQEPDRLQVERRLGEVVARSGLTLPTERINPVRPSPNARGLSAVTRHGLASFKDLFAPRQLLCLLVWAEALRAVAIEMRRAGYQEDHVKAVATSLALALDKMADYSNTVTRWGNDDEGVTNAFSRQALPMVWDYAEPFPWSGTTGSWQWAVRHIADVYAAQVPSGSARPDAVVVRGSATELPWAGESMFDAIVTDPPYYDNVPYADISDFFYVWLKRTIGSLHSEHFSSELTPKKAEATALSSRHAGDMSKASAEYEGMMLAAFKEGCRLLKPRAPMVVVYAHKTTLGWATLVDALRRAGLAVTEAWPLGTESGARLAAHDTASLASSIFIVARKREASTRAASYERDVRPDLERIVSERVESLWSLGISGADLVIACVGAGLRAFTRFSRVEYENGEEVPAERFLTEVETVVLESILTKLSKEVSGNGGRQSLAGVDPATRFYTLWRYTYRGADLEAGEAIVFANGTHVELDGAGGLTSGPRPLVEKKKGKYRLRDHRVRGGDEKLGLRQSPGDPVSVIDVLQRILWLLENGPATLPSFLREVQPNREQMRLVAQALAGPALRGGQSSDVSRSAELSALAKLMANWRSLIDDVALTPMEREERRTGQAGLDFGKGGHA